MVETGRGGAFGQSDADVRFEVPVGPELANRFGSVLEVVYLIFNEGYAATSGESWYRAELCDEAMRLGRMLSALAPEEPEAHGLVALMEIQASRIPARTGPGGAPVTLLEQNRARWNRLLITHGLAALAKARAAARKRSAGQPGPYCLQAELAACHARAATAADTDWRRIVGLYETLGGLNPSPVIELNRAVAVAMADSANGPARALAIVDSLGGRAHRQRQRARPPAPPPQQPQRPQQQPPTPSRARYRAQLYGVVVETLTRPDRSRIGRENSVESLLMYFLPIRSADRARSAVSAR